MAMATNETRDIKEDNGTEGEREEIIEIMERKREEQRFDTMKDKTNEPQGEPTEPEAEPVIVLDDTKVNAETLPGEGEETAV